MKTINMYKMTVLKKEYGFSKLKYEILVKDAHLDALNYEMKRIIDEYISANLKCELSPDILNLEN